MVAHFQYDIFPLSHIFYALFDVLAIQSVSIPFAAFVFVA